MVTRNASCACGKIRLECDGAPVRVSMCHCFECQRRTGSVFGVQARFERDRVRLVGGAKQYCRVAESGNRITFTFCGRCGSTVYWQNEAAPDLIVVAVGAFADCGFAAPTVSVWERRKHDWVTMPTGVAEHVD